MNDLTVIIDSSSHTGDTVTQLTLHHMGVFGGGNYLELFQPSFPEEFIATGRANAQSRAKAELL